MKHLITVLSMFVLVSCGAVGPAGSPGAVGDPGADGVAGLDGSDGANGSDGSNGADGQDGAVGAVGPAYAPSVVLYTFPSVGTCLAIEGYGFKRANGGSLEVYTSQACSGSLLFSSKNIVSINGKLLFIETNTSGAVEATLVGF